MRLSQRVWQKDPHEEILKAFKLFDDDDSGKISLRNLRRVARELGENMSDEELRAMIEEFDKDGDGESKFWVKHIFQIFLLVHMSNFFKTKWFSRPFANCPFI